MANRKISDLTALTAPATGDLLPIVDISEGIAADKNKKITYGELLASAPAGTAAAPSFSFDSDPNSGLYSAGADQVAISAGGTGQLIVDTTAITSTVPIVYPLGTAAAPSLTFTGSTNTGLYSPGSGQLAISTNGTQRLTVDTAATTSTLPVVHPLGAVGTPSITFTGDLNTGLFSPGADTVALVTGGTNRLHITSAGLVGLGTSGPDAKLHVVSGSTPSIAQLYIGQGGGSNNYYDANNHYFRDGNLNNVISTTSSTIQLFTGATERVRIDSSGRVGIGTSVPGSILDIRFSTNPVVDNGGGADALRVWTSSALAADAGGAVSFGGVATSGGAFASWAQIAGRKENATSGAYGGYLQFAVNTGSGTMSERARLTSDGKFLVGTSTALNATSGNAPALQVAATLGQALIASTSASNTQPVLHLANSNGSHTTLIGGGWGLGKISFNGGDGSNCIPGASIEAIVDGAPSANDMPGRLVFSTTADGASSPTERFRISNDGSFSSVIPGGSTLYPRFGCRAWVNFNGTGTVAIRASGNVSSITDNGTGDYTVNFTTAMPDANYCAVVTGSSTDQGTGCIVMDILGSTAPTASAIRVLSEASAGPNVDSEFSNVVIFR